MAPKIPTRRDLEGKVAVITGGASGIGAATTKLFVQNGAKVVVADTKDQLEKSRCRDLNKDGTVCYVHCDVTSDADVKNAIDTARSKYGKLDIMYYNAGILPCSDQTIQSSDNERFKKVLEVKVYGAFLGAKHAARVMVPAKSGVILFTASTATVVAGGAPHAYAMAGLMSYLSVELGQHGIRVNCISPGAVQEPEEVAKAAVYLSSDGSKSVTGLNIVMDKGGNTRMPNQVILPRGPFP